MRHKAVKVRLYPTLEQQLLLSQHFGCTRWWWNYALYKSIDQSIVSIQTAAKMMWLEN
jgi:putative transposase